jgi:2-hydroxy-3-oxopropionate reductase
MASRVIGFIGLGIMGRPMARNLLDAGYPLVVYDLSRQRVEPLLQVGASDGQSPVQVAEASDVVITMLPDSPEVEQVALGESGVLCSMRPGTVFVDMSTVSPQTAVRIAEQAAKNDIEALDAPVSGGEVGAEKGTLSIMVGGSEKAFLELLPLFRVLGKNVVLCGGPGAGQTVKACNQVLVAITIAGVAEALVLGAKAGIDPAKVVEVLRGGLARCGVLENRGDRMIDRDFQPGFRSRLHYKDLRIAVAAGQAYGAVLPLTAQVHELFKEMTLQGRGDMDHSGLLTLVEELSMIVVRRHEVRSIGPAQGG